MESAIRRLAATKIGEGVSWTAGWSAHELNNAERNDFDHIIVGLSDWAALSGQGEDVDKQLRHTQPPVSVTQGRLAFAESS